jgi:hypothetical protein
MRTNSDICEIIPTAKRRPQLRLLLARLLLIIGGVFVALIIVEIALRIGGFNYFNPYVVDQDLGYSLRPGAEGWWTREGLTYVKINSLGFRDREHPIAKPPDTFRIAILGDSFAEAFQVPLDKTFWSVIEQRLQQCPRTAKANVEVMNFGVSGFSTARELILLQKRVWQYSPDIVVLLVTVANDIRDNSRSLNEYRMLPLPYFILQDGKLVLDDSLLTARNRTLSFRLRNSLVGHLYPWLQNHVRVLGLIYTFREAYETSRLSKREKQSSDRAVDNEPGLDSEVYRKPTTVEWEEAWRVTEALLVKMRDEVQMKGAKFLVVTGSSSVQVTPNTTTRQQFMKSLGIDSLFYPDERIKSLAQAEGFSVLNLAPSLYEYSSVNGVFVHGSSETGGKGHWNEIGHRLAGELIAREICRADL